MKAIHRNALAFCAASAATLAGWISLWPSPSAKTKTLPPAGGGIEMSKDLPTPSTAEKIRAAIEACTTAGTAEERLRAATELGRIPLNQVQEALESVPAAKDGQITLGAKILLIRWAGSDGEAAMKWAWVHFRPTAQYGTWGEAFNEIGPAWAWHDAAGFYCWTSGLENLGQNEIPAADVEDKETPMLSISQVSDICRWIAPEEPRLAYELMFRRNGISSQDYELAETFNLEQVKEALGAFANVSLPGSGASTEKQLHAQLLLSRWQKLDPADFARSPYAALMEGDREQIMTSTFREWKAQAPGNRAATATRLIDSRRKQDSHQKVNAWGPLPVGAEIIVQDCVGVIANAWAAEDPAATHEWLATLPEAEREASYRAMVAAAAPRDLNLALGQAEKLPPRERMAGTARAFAAWSEDHPGENPDASGWSEQRIRAWEEWSFLRK